MAVNTSDAVDGCDKRIEGVWGLNSTKTRRIKRKASEMRRKKDRLECWVGEESEIMTKRWRMVDVEMVLGSKFYRPPSFALAERGDMSRGRRGRGHKGG